MYRPLWSAGVLDELRRNLTEKARVADEAAAAAYKSPAMSAEDLLGRLAAAGVPRFASEARRHLG